MDRFPRKPAHYVKPENRFLQQIKRARAVGSPTLPPRQPPPPELPSWDLPVPRDLPGPVAMLPEDQTDG